MTLSWNGVGQWYLPRSYTLTVRPGIKYGHINSDSRTAGTGYDIVNDAREKTWDYNLRAFLSRQFGQQMFTLALWGRRTNYAIEYSGTSAADLHTRYAHAVAWLQANLRFGKFWANGYVQAGWSRSATNGMTNYDHVTPHYGVTLGYNPSQRTQLQLNSELWFTEPETSQLTRDMFLQTPLFAITGNPSLKNSRINNVGASWTQFLSGAFSMSANLGYARASNPRIETYERIEYDGREIILRGYDNIAYYEDLDYGVNLSGRFLSNTLTGTVRVGGKYADYSTTMKRSMNRFNYSANINWMHGNWFLAAYYQSANKTISATGWRKETPIYYVAWGWGNGDWTLRVFVWNPFSDSWTAVKTRIDTPVYQSLSTLYDANPHRRIQLSASWSISYGKKVERRIDLNAPEEASSGILR